MLARHQGLASNRHHPGRLNHTTSRFTENHDYFLVRLIGTGTFGAVFEVRDTEGRHLAVKKVVQDPHYKNRELDTLRKLNHPNCLHLIRSFFTREGNPVQTYLHIVTDLFPTDLWRYSKADPDPPLDIVRIFAYQVFRGLAYMHSIGICHRDIKPTNVLIDPETGRLQLCDLGSAKPMNDGETGVSYIATRSYRAPELLYGFTRYSFPVDVWAAGCVIAELVNGGRTVFSGNSNDELIIDIASVIGPASKEDLAEYGTTKRAVMATGRKRGIENAIGRKIDPQLKDLLERIFVYGQRKRIIAQACMEHPFFERVRTGQCRLANGLLFALGS